VIFTLTTHVGLPFVVVNVARIGVAVTRHSGSEACNGWIERDDGSDAAFRL